MIINILEKMVNLREKQDGKNYRNLTYILEENLRGDYFNASLEQIHKINTDLFYKIIEKIRIEIDCNLIILKNTLNTNDYGSFKIMSQAHNCLKHIYEKLETTKYIIYHTEK